MLAGNPCGERLRPVCCAPMPSLLLVISDAQQRNALSEAFHGAGFEVCAEADAAAATRRVKDGATAPFTAVLAEVQSRRLAVEKLLLASKATEPRPRTFVLLDETAMAPDDAWEAQPVDVRGGDALVVEAVQRALGDSLPAAWRFQSLRSLAARSTWASAWAKPPQSPKQFLVLARMHAPTAGADVDSEQRRRDAFAAQVKEAGRVSHPALAVVGLREASGTLPFLTYDVPEGVTLSEIIRLTPAPPLERAVALHLVLQAAEALGALHGKGAIHGGLDRRSLWISRDGAVRVLFAGLGDPPSSDVVTRAKRHQVRVDEWAPEELRGGIPDARSDVYRLGMLLYGLLTQRRPFERKKPDESVGAVLNSPPLPPSKLVGGIAPENEALLMEMLSKDRTARPDMPTVLPKLRAWAEASLHPDADRPWWQRVVKREVTLDPQAMLVERVQETLRTIAKNVG